MIIAAKQKIFLICPSQKSIYDSAQEQISGFPWKMYICCKADGVEGEPDLSTEEININIRGVHFHL